MPDATLTRSAYVEASIAAAKAWLSVEFAMYSGKKLPIVLAKTVEEFRQFGRVDSNDGNKSPLQSPFALMSLGSIGLDGERAGFKRNRVNNGVRTGSDRERGVSYHDDLRPAILGIGLAFISDSIDDVMLFAETLLFAAPVVTLSIASEHGFIANCSLLIDGELTIPPPDSDVGSIYRFESPLRLRTFIGHSKEMRLIRKLIVNVVDGEPESNTIGSSIYNGDATTLLSTAFTYQDLFNKDSSAYKYDYNTVNNGDDT